MHVCFVDLNHHKYAGYSFILNIFSENQWEFEDQMEVNNRSSILQRKIKKNSIVIFMIPSKSIFGIIFV